jgi:hypothetical protein
MMGVTTHNVTVDITVLWIDGIIYTRIYVHVINIYLHKHLYTTKHLVYTVIYACIQCIQDKAQNRTQYILGMYAYIPSI